MHAVEPLPTAVAPLDSQSLPLVLVVEDDTAMAAFMRESLRRRSRVEVAYDGETGLRLARQLRPDLIVSDLQMPRLSGEELLSAVRKDSSLDGVPVIMVTGSADVETRVRLLKAGAQDYLVKPLAHAELQVRVFNMVAMKRARDVLRNALGSPSAELEVLAAEAVARKEELQAALESLRQSEQERGDLLARERAARVEAEDALHARDEFLSIAAHELKTPVTSLRGYSELLLRQLSERVADPHTLERGLRTIDRQAGRLGRLIANLLELSRIEGGSFRLVVQPVDLALIVATAVDSMREVSRRHTISTDIDGPLMVIGDRLLLEQVMHNLLDNAIKYSPDGGPIQVRGWSEHSTHYISIRDHGLGIPAEHLPRVFDRLHRAHEHQHASGLGLGLYICEEIVRRHGGAIDATSPGQAGTRLCVALPASDSANRREQTFE